ncbi:MAG: hypothetical protein ACK443_05780 [Methylococcaceae bacterium]|jgi:hypothetical protein
MKKTFPAQHRLTHRYKPAFSYMDEWQTYPGEFHLLKQTVLKVGDWDESTTVLYRVVAPKGMDPRTVRRCLSETFTRGGCSHDYDCCGCSFSSAYPIKQISKREWLVWEHISYNY